MNPAPPLSQQPECASPSQAQTAPRPCGGDVEVLPSAALLRGQKSVTIHHNGLLYRLQTTRHGKLILTK